MIRNDQVQAAFIAYFKGNTTITAQLGGSSEEIREDQWQGTIFTYPNVRFRLFSNVPSDGHDGCNQSMIRASVECRSEEASSQEADRISGIITNELHRKSFTRSGVRVQGIRVNNVVPALREDAQTFRSEVLFSAVVN